MTDLESVITLGWLSGIQSNNILTAIRYPLSFYYFVFREASRSPSPDRNPPLKAADEEVVEE